MAECFDNHYNAYSNGLDHAFTNRYVNQFIEQIVEEHTKIWDVVMFRINEQLNYLLKAKSPDIIDNKLSAPSEIHKIVQEYDDNIRKLLGHYTIRYRKIDKRTNNTLQRVTILQKIKDYQPVPLSFKAKIGKKGIANRYKCPFCDKQFKTTVAGYEIANHIRYKHKKKPYYCYGCNKRFNVLTDLSKHHVKCVHKTKKIHDKFSVFIPPNRSSSLDTGKPTKKGDYYCICEKYEIHGEETEDMIMCDVCCNYFHGSCVNVNCQTWGEEPWYCFGCLHTPGTELLNELNANTLKKLLDWLQHPTKHSGELLANKIKVDLKKRSKKKLSNPVIIQLYKIDKLCIKYKHLKHCIQELIKQTSNLSNREFINKIKKQ